jgi:glyoxylate reductase
MIIKKGKTIYPKKPQKYLEDKNLSKPKVQITRKFFDKAIDHIKTIAELKYIRARTTQFQDVSFLKKPKRCKDLFPMLTDRVDQELLDKSKNLKVVSNYAVGYARVATNLTAALKGERPPDLLNPEVLE